jgi:hypothetical protein
VKAYSDNYVISKYKQATRLAQECLNAVESGLVDQIYVRDLARTILAADLASGGTSLNKHSGRDEDQESMLQGAFEAGSAAQVRPGR